MRQTRISIAAASLAALVVGIGPATAQSVSGQTPSGRGPVTTDTDRGSASIDCDTASSAPSTSPRRSGTTNDGPRVSGTTSDEANAARDRDSGASIDCQFPSASPPMNDDTRSPDDRELLKQQPQLDRNDNRDRG